MILFHLENFFRYLRGDLEEISAANSRTNALKNSWIQTLSSHVFTIKPTHYDLGVISWESQLCRFLFNISRQSAIPALAEGFSNIEDFGKTKREWLKKILDPPNGTPSHDTIRCVFCLLDHSKPQKLFDKQFLKQRLTNWMQAISSLSKGKKNGLRWKNHWPTIYH